MEQAQVKEKSREHKVTGFKSLSASCNCKEVKMIGSISVGNNNGTAIFSVVKCEKCGISRFEEKRISNESRNDNKK